jgi:hypothetical protein
MRFLLILVLHNKLEYRVTLDTNLNLFIVFDKKDENKFATGTTIENAVQDERQLKRS